MKTRCAICLKWAVKDNLCASHNRTLMYDKELGGYRLRKRKNGTSTRYTKSKFHKNEILLTKVVESIFGFDKVVTSYHPLWAKTEKGALYEFDIAIPSQNILIEYNGAQHYKFVSIFHRTRKRFKAQQDRDKQKKALAEKNGHTLIVFKFNEPLMQDYVATKINNEIAKRSDQ